MRKLAIAMALASTALATPAVARDGSWYVGIEGGGMIVEDTELDYDNGVRNVDDGVVVDYKTGVDADILTGYDMGMVRLEVELGYKRASVDNIIIDRAVSANTFTDFGGRGTALSAMANVLLDFGNEDWSGYVGPGIGLAKVKLRGSADLLSVSDSDSAIAWQVVAGVRKAITPNLDLGLKYRFFNTGKLNFGGESELGAPFGLDGRWRSHSLLASLIFNFAA
ncbi:MAG: outer membrane beta-barrel protein, partial [Sphingomicrobium sp.]